MRRRLSLITLIVVYLLLGSSPGYCLKEETHIAINVNIASSTINDFSLHNYVLKILGFRDGPKELLFGHSDRYKDDLAQTVAAWLGEGGIMEDRPGDWYDFVPWSQTRSVNHFHNPLKPWNEAGLNDIYSGQSSILWAQKGHLGSNLIC